MTVIKVGTRTPAADRSQPLQPSSAAQETFSDRTAPSYGSDDHQKRHDGRARAGDTLIACGASASRRSPSPLCGMLGSWLEGARLGWMCRSPRRTWSARQTSAIQSL